MQSLLAYIIQVNILLAILYVGYIFLLKGLTFYKLNRLYFLSGAVFSLIYPFLDIKSLFEKHIEPVGELISFLPYLAQPEEQASIYTVENLVYAIISLGILFLGIKLITQLFSLLRIHFHSVEAAWKSYLYRNVLLPIVPFSFLNKIYLNKEQHEELELYDIFEHEHIHVKGLHTVDILLFEILLIGCWYNPFVWLMRRAVRQNLEFLTDQQVLSKGVDRQTYQYSLLHVSKQGASVSISNQFNFKLLKKRIMMMNKKRSSKLQLSKYAFLLPIIIFSAGAFTVSKADSHIVEVIQIAKDTDVSDLKSVLVEPLAPLPLDTAEIMADDPENNPSDTLGNGELVDEPAIAGKVTGLFLQVDSGAAKSPRITLRGTSALQGTPLVIVDGERKAFGFELSELNSDNIKEVRIVRKSEPHRIDLYGTEARDGVIEIKTKKSGQTTGTSRLSVTDTTKAQSVKTVVVRGRKSQVSDVNGLTTKGLGIAENTPLFVIDGVVKDDQNLDDLNPDDIESINILKDASATSLYGQKGANGVIFVTTKVGGAKGTKEVQGLSVSTKKNKEVVVVGYGAKVKPTQDGTFYEASNPASLKKFLDDNRANIDLSKDFVLVINGKVASEADLKKIKAVDVSQVGAMDLTTDNSNLPKNVIALLYLKDGNPRANNGASAAVYNTKKKIELVVKPEKKDFPYIERK